MNDFYKQGALTEQKKKQKKMGTHGRYKSARQRKLHKSDIVWSIIAFPYSGSSLKIKIHRGCIPPGVPMERLNYFPDMF